jgi:hypothetical protein
VTLSGTITPTPGLVAVRLDIYDSSGLLLRSLDGGTGSALVSAVTLSQDPYDPASGPLVLSQAGAWAYPYNGLDASGAVLRNGLYLLVVHSQQGSQSASVSVPVRVLGQGAGSVTLLAAPMPAPVNGGAVTLQWSPALPVKLELHSLDGGLVRDFGLVSPPVLWDLRSAGGAGVAPGFYVASARVQGQREARLLKLVVTR